MITAVVTGAARGIGAGGAERLAADGLRVAVIGSVVGAPSYVMPRIEMTVAPRPVRSSRRCWMPA